MSPSCLCVCVFGNEALWSNGATTQGRVLKSGLMCWEILESLKEEKTFSYVGPLPHPTALISFVLVINGRSKAAPGGFQTLPFIQCVWSPAVLGAGIRIQEE